MADNRVWVLGKGIIPITNTQTQNTQKNCVLGIGYGYGYGMIPILNQGCVHATIM